MGVLELLALAAAAAFGSFSFEEAVALLVVDDSLLVRISSLLGQTTLLGTLFSLECSTLSLLL